MAPTLFTKFYLRNALGLGLSFCLNPQWRRVENSLYRFATLSTEWCLLSSLMPPRYSKISLMMCSKTCWIRSSFQPCMSGWFWDVCLRITSLWKTRRANSMLRLRHFWFSSFSKASCHPTQPRFRQWWTGQPQPTGRNFNSSWGSLSFTDASYRITTGWWPPWRTTILCPSPGQREPRRPLLFTSALLLLHLDLARQFLLEVEGSDMGIGAVHSQWNTTDGKLHNCGFFRQSLYPIKQNYNVGNHKLLVLVLFLLEWCLWLEWATQPFIVWPAFALCTNHPQGSCSLWPPHGGPGLCDWTSTAV